MNAMFVYFTNGDYKFGFCLRTLGIKPNSFRETKTLNNEMDE